MVLGVSLSLFFLIPEITKIIPKLASHDTPWLLSVSWLFNEFKSEYVSISPLLLCGLLIVIIGLIDDSHGLSPFVRLVFQLATTLLLIFSESTFCLNISEIPAIDISTTALCIIILTNAFNFLDNMDGLSAGLGAISTIFIGYMALLIGDFSIAFLAFTIFGALCGFLIFNLPPASIFMGDAGGMGLGFTIGALTIKLTNWDAFSSDPILQLSPLLIASIPFYDVFTVSLLRLKLGQPPWIGDKNHISHRLVRMGLSKQNTVVTLYLILFLLSLPPLLAIHPSGDIKWIWITPLSIIILSAIDFYGYRNTSQNE